MPQEGGEHSRHWLWQGATAQKNPYAICPLPSLALRLLLNGAIPDMERCGQAMYRGGAAALEGAVASPHPRQAANQEQL